MDKIDMLNELEESGAPILDLGLSNVTPKLSQHFYSLEGEGMTVGRAALFLRINGCNARCVFCDTSFSIKGDPKYDLVDMTGPEFINFLETEYKELDKNLVTSVTITGGEPLKNIKHYTKMFENIFKVFPKVDNVIFETNGVYLSDESNCLKLLKGLRKFKKITFTLSISPKLSGKISWGNKDDMDIMEIYKDVVHNYVYYLESFFNIQMKFIYFGDENYHMNNLNNLLIDYCKEVNIPLSQILIMPFTPSDPIGKDSNKWTQSKDEAARYALKNSYRYSPRLHIDRKLE